MFVPLHLHTEYSFLDGKITPKGLIKYCNENDLKSIAITDHGNMCGTIDFYQKLKAEKIKLIVGCEFYLYHGSFEQMRELKTREGYHLVLLAKNQTGYRNLIKLHNIAQRDGFYYKPKINLEALRSHSEGLICLSACLGGDIQQSILKDDRKRATELVEMYKEIFGEDFYIEFQDHGIPEQAKVNPILLDICKEYNMKPVITTDAHYVYKEEYEAHDLLLCMNTGKTVNDPNRLKFDFKPYLQTETEIREVFKWMPQDFLDQSIKNTELIAEQCNVDFEFGKYMIPDFEVPEEIKDQDDYLKKLSVIGMQKRYGKNGHIDKTIPERLSYELDVIQKMGFAGYFLIVADIVNWAKENGIPVGVGRGSAGGSLVCYCIGITDIDPMRHHLLFERFLNPDRVSMPDIDIDFAPECREKVIAYIKSKYGEDHVCQIVTFGTLATKASIKAVARVLNVPFSESNALTDAIPDDAKSVDSAIEGSKVIQDLYFQKPLIKKVLDFARELEGLKCNSGVHASGIVISKYPLDECMPLVRTKDKGLATAYAMKQVDALGFLKLDVLGLRNLTVIDNTITMLADRGISIDVLNLPENDPNTYNMLKKGLSKGVFQIESGIMKRLLLDIQPENIEDICAINALARPGCLNSGLTDKFVKIRQGKLEPEYIVPELKPLTESTYGLPLYQENCMQMARIIAGYTLAESDDLRKAIGKKDPIGMEKHKKKFTDGAVNQGYSAEFAEKCIDIIKEFSNYGFNASHSMAYSYITYQTAYLKANYPIEYMTALLNSVSDDMEKLKEYLDDCYKIGVKLLPPDVNESNEVFTVTSEGIRFGLSAIKGLGKVSKEIIKERKKGKFTSFLNFCKRCNSANRTQLEHLCQVNAFKSIESNSKRCVVLLEAFLTAKDKKDQVRFKKGDKKNYADHDYSFDEIIDYFIKDKNLNVNVVDYNILETEKFERDYLGFYVSSHPLQRVKAIEEDLVTHSIDQVIELQNDPEDMWVEKSSKSGVTYSYKKQIRFIGIIKASRTHTTYKGDPMAFLTVESFDSSIDVTVFNNAYADSKVKEGNLIIVKGKPQKQPDNNFSPYCVIADYIGVIDYQKEIYLDVSGKSLEQLEAIKNQLKLNIGYNPVILAYNENKIRTGKRYWVKDLNILV